MAGPGTAAIPLAGTQTAQPQSPPVVVQSEIQPSIEVLPQQANLAGRCNGSAFDLNTFINATPQTSADVRVTAPSVNPPLLEDFTDNTGANVGSFNAVYPNFHILAFGGGLAPNTPIVITITTWTGPNLTGSVTFTSTISFNCTTGAVLRLARDPPLRPAIPALDGAGLAVLALLLALAGSVAARKRVARARSRR